MTGRTQGDTGLGRLWLLDPTAWERRSRSAPGVAMRVRVGGEGQGLKAELSQGRAGEENALERRALGLVAAPPVPSAGKASATAKRSGAGEQSRSPSSATKGGASGDDVTSGEVRSRGKSFPIGPCQPRRTLACRSQAQDQRGPAGEARRGGQGRQGRGRRSVEVRAGASCERHVWRRGGLHAARAGEGAPRVTLCGPLRRQRSKGQKGPLLPVVPGRAALLREPRGQAAAQRPLC